MRVLIGLGANLGDRERSLAAATAALACLGPVRRSRWFETAPAEYGDEEPQMPDFLNGALSLDTSLEPGELLRFSGTVESRLGRPGHARSGPRTIDIDILLIGGRVLDLPGLEIPHPRMHTRPFVLVPLAEVAADAVHPVLQLTVREMLERVGSNGVKCMEAA